MSVWSLNMGLIHDDGSIGNEVACECPSLECVLEVIEAAMDAADRRSAWDLTIEKP